MATHEVVCAAAVKRVPEEVQQDEFPARTHSPELIITACMHACRPSCDQ
jgi:hypothetical protein